MRDQVEQLKRPGFSAATKGIRKESDANENLLYSKMWSNNYMYSVLVKDYRCTQLHLRMLCHENYISVMSVVQHNQLSTSVLNK